MDFSETNVTINTNIHQQYQINLLLEIQQNIIY